MAYAQQQPMATPGMTVAAGNRNAKNLPVDANGREWSNGLFDCGGDCATFLISWFLPCVTFGQIKRRYEHLNSKGYPDPDHGGFCSSDCMLHGCFTLCGCGFIMQMGNRGSIRGRYNIKGGGCTDCLTSLCCTPCELAQEAQELTLEENSFQQGQGKQY